MPLLVLHPQVEASPQLSVEARRHGSGDWFPRKARVPLGRHDHARAATDGPDDAALQVRCLQEQAFTSSLKEAVWTCPPMVNETRRSAEFPTVPFVWLSVTRLVHPGLTPAKDRKGGRSEDSGARAGLMRRGREKERIIALCGGSLAKQPIASKHFAPACLRAGCGHGG